MNFEIYDRAMLRSALWTQNLSKSWLDAVFSSLPRSEALFQKLDSILAVEQLDAVILGGKRLPRIVEGIESALDLLGCDLSDESEESLLSSTWADDWSMRLLLSIYSGHDTSMMLHLWPAFSEWAEWTNPDDTRELNNCLTGKAYDRRWLETVDADSSRWWLVEAAMLSILCKLPLDSPLERFMDIRRPSSSWRSTWAGYALDFIAGVVHKAPAEPPIGEEIGRIMDDILSRRRPIGSLTEIVNRDAAKHGEVLSYLHRLVRIYEPVLLTIRPEALLAFYDEHDNPIRRALKMLRSMPQQINEEVNAIKRKRNLKLRLIEERKREFAEKRLAAQQRREDLEAAVALIWKTGRTRSWPKGLWSDTKRVQTLVSTLKALLEYGNGGYRISGRRMPSFKYVKELVREIREALPELPEEIDLEDPAAISRAAEQACVARDEAEEAEENECSFADSYEESEADRPHSEQTLSQEPAYSSYWVDPEEERRKQREQEEREERLAERERRRQEREKEEFDNWCRESSQALTDSLRQQEQWSQWINRGP